MNDTFTTASSDGLKWASDPAHGYTFLRTEGYCMPMPAQGDDSTVWVAYYGEARKDMFLVHKGSPAEKSATGAGYKLMWEECWVPKPPQIWTTWNDSSAAVGSPFPKYDTPHTPALTCHRSTDILSWQYLAGANGCSHDVLVKYLHWL